MAASIDYRPFPDEQGALRSARLPWDEAAFGFPVFDLRIDEAKPLVVAEHLPGLVKEWASVGRCFGVATTSTRSTRVGQILTQNGFFVVESLVDLSLSLAWVKPVELPRTSQLRLGWAKESDLPRIVEISRSTFVHDRMHMDWNIPTELADRRFTRWIESAFRSHERIYVCEDADRGEVVGFVYCTDPSEGIVNIVLSAVDEDYKGTAVAVWMAGNCLEKFREAGVQVARTSISINNIESLNLSLSLGFTLRRGVTKFHWHSIPPS